MQPIVLHVAAEVAPFHKSGGLGDVLGGLPPALGRAGIDVRIVTGLYGDDSKFGSIGGRQALRAWPVQLDVSLAGNPMRASVWEARTHGGEATTYFVEAPNLSRGTLYGYRDDPYRFAILSKAAVKIAAILQRARRLGPVAAIHAHDWHAALSLWYARQAAETRGVPTIFTIHNLAYQGEVEASSSRYFDVGWEAYHSVFEHQGVLNLMKGAIVLAHRVTTVSPNYAREMQTREHGMRLDWLLRSVDRKLFGLLNGIDEGAWDPATDAALPANFSRDDLDGKEACRAALRFEAGLYPPGDRVVPIVGAVSRLTHQKGLDQLCDVAPALVAQGAQIVVLGTGDRSVEERLHWLAVSHPGAIAFRRAFDENVAHRIYAGSDLFAMPSRFEPCGLTQMYAMRYGSLPVARSTGGLADTIFPLQNRYDVGGATGFLFHGDGSDGFERALRWGVEVVRDRDALHAMRRNAMAQDNSWNIAAGAYVRMYRELGVEPEARRASLPPGPPSDSGIDEREG